MTGTAAGAPAAPERPLEEMLDGAFAPLDAAALGIAVGVVCGAFLLLGSIVLLAGGGRNVGAHLVLLAHFLVGYGMNWPGFWLGTAEVTALGGLLGWGSAHLHNMFLRSYVHLVRRAAAAAERRALERA